METDASAALPATWHPILLADQVPGERLRCNLCPRRCQLSTGQIGYCRAVRNEEGHLYSTVYGIVAAAGADPIEKKPVYHYRPGTFVLTLGSLGCNFRCDFCQNWEVAYADGSNAGGLTEPNLLPAAAVALARERGCQGLAWSYNEPTIWLDYVYDCARLAHQAGQYTVFVTNGYITTEALDTLAPYLNVFRVDVKSLTDHFYSRLAQGGHVAPVLAAAERAGRHWGLHVEVVTNIVPGWNDDPANLSATANWIATKLGCATPWHVTRFVPYARMLSVPPTPTATLAQATTLGHAAGLQFVYDDPAGGKAQTTFCPGCGRPLIRREGYGVRCAAELQGGSCAACGTRLPGVFV